MDLLISRVSLIVIAPRCRTDILDGLVNVVYRTFINSSARPCVLAAGNIYNKQLYYTFTLFPAYLSPTSRGFKDRHYRKQTRIVREVVFKVIREFRVYLQL